MQVACGNCQLSFQAPEGAAGLMCPICRSPLRPAQASGEAAASKNITEWEGGSLDDLVAFLSGPAWAVRVEILPAKGDTPVGEVHLLAGGFSEVLLGGKSTDDALDKLRAVPGARFRIEQRLPNPTDGDLASPGPESGTLDSRPLAHLMRYCEQYVITCGIEVWRGSEAARVEYRKGEISGVTVGGIDAPERLAEVMQWSSGNYRLIVPPLNMPEAIPRAIKPAPAEKAAPVAPAAAPARPPATPSAARPAPTPALTPPSARPAAPAPAAAAAAPPAPPAPAPAAPARAPLSAHATRTIFGMPALDVAGLKAAAEAAAAVTRQASAQASGATSSAPATSPTTSPPVIAAPVLAPAAAAPVAAANDRQGSTKTIFGVPAPRVPDKGADAARAAAAAPTPAAAAAAAESAPQRNDRKTGARKTVVPAPAIIPPASDTAPAPASLAAAAEASRTTHQGYGGQPSAIEVVPAKTPAVAEDRTAPVRVAATAKKSRGIPVWTYVGVGFLFGLALLGIYQLVGVLAH
jgi:hypothetical protein